MFQDEEEMHTLYAHKPCLCLLKKSAMKIEMIKELDHMKKERKGRKRGWNNPTITQKWVMMELLKHRGMGLAQNSI